MRAQFSATMLAAFFSTSALAQVPAQVPQAPTREEIERPGLAPTAPPPPRLTVEGGIERAPCPLADPRFANVTVTLSAVQFDNLRVVPAEALRSAYEGFLGRTVPIAAVCEIRDAAATILRREGYLAAVQVPAQRIENGVVRFDVLMAKLVGVQVRGDAGGAERLIAGYLRRLQGEEAFNQNTAERYLLLARDIPGLDVRLTLRPAGTVPGEVIGEVAVLRQRFSVDANFQNLGSTDVGRFGGLIRGEAYGLLGLGDRLTLGYFTTPDLEEQHVFQSAYEFRAGSSGLTLGGRFTYAWTKPSIGGGIDLKSETLVAGVEARFPFLRTQARNLRGTLGLDYVDQEVSFLGGLATNEDRLRVAYARLDYEAVDPDSLTGLGGFTINEPRWRLAGSFEARQGLDILDASPSCGPAPFFPVCLGANAVGRSRVEGDPTAAVLRLSGQAEYRPSPLFAFSLAPALQYAWNPLLSFEEFSGGNYSVGRGYDPGSIIGDSGAGFQAEARYGTIVPRSRRGFAFQPFAFVDAAWVWNRDDAANGTNPQNLVSGGGGMRVAYGGRARLDLSIATPLKRAGLQQRRGSARVLLSLTTKLFP